MQEDWILVYSTNLEYQAELVKQMLENEGIIVQTLNKRDSTYGSFGDIEIYVYKDEIIKSIRLIKEFESE